MNLLILLIVVNICSAECISHLKQAETEVFEMNLPVGMKREGEMSDEEKLVEKPFKVYFDTSALEEEVVNKGFSISSTPICFPLKEGETAQGDCANEANILTKEKKDYIIQKIIPEVKKNMELFFKVHKTTIKDLYTYLSSEEYGGRPTRTENNTNLEDGKKYYKCGEVKVIDPSSYLKQIEKDEIGMVMYVTAHPVESQTVLAYAASCVSSNAYISKSVSTNPSMKDQDKTPKILDKDGGLVRRNIMGYTNINPAGLEVEDGKVRINAHTVLHETMHAMGFTDKAVQWAFKKGNNGGYKGKVIRTKRVLDTARIYFGDDTIDYVEFEDGGGAGTAGAHWEKRVLYNEIMTGTSSYYSAISNFTLAFFHDLGTFIPNYQYAEKLTWGKGMKKDFFDCANWKKDEAPYGGTYMKRGCTGDRGSIGMSDQTSTVAELPSQYQRSDGLTKYGTNEIMDYCPHTTLAAGGQCYKKNGVVDAISSFSFVERGSTYGPQSRCLDTTLVMVGIPLDDFGCYNVQCLEKDRGYRIQINDDWYLCDNSEVTVYGYFGSVKCPPREEMCPDELHDESSRTWPDVLKIEPEVAKIGTKITITGKYLNKMDAIYIGGVLQNATSKIDCPTVVQPGTETKCQLVVDAIKFDDIFFDIISLIKDGNVPIDVVVAGGSTNSPDRQRNAVYVGFKLEISVEDFFIVFMEFVVNNVFFVAGLIMLLIWIIFLICFLVAKRIIRHKAKQLAREYISY